MRFAVIVALTLLGTAPAPPKQAPARPAGPLPGLAVSDNKRFLVTADGRPFFWLGDTAWELFHRLNREDAHRYLRNRAERRFTVDPGGGARGARRARTTRTHTAIGRSLDNDPATPDVKDGPANDYWDHVDFIVDRGRSAGDLHRLAADMGRQVEHAAGRRAGGVHAAERRDLRRVARARATRTRRTSSGSSAAIGRSKRRAQGDHPGHGARAPRGRRRRAPDHVPSDRRQGSSTCSTTTTWLDFNMRQNGHVAGVHRPLRPDARRLRPHAGQAGPRRRADLRGPSGLVQRADLGHSIAGDVRRPLYWDLFSGAFGHTYGHHSVWQMWAPGPHPGQQPADAVVRRDRSARRGADAACAGAARVAAVPVPRSRQQPHRGRRGADGHAGRRPLPLRRHARCERQLRDGLCAGRPAVHGAHERDFGNAGVGVVVQPANRQGDRDRHRRQLRGPHVHAAGRGRNARLGAGPRRCVEVVRPARPVGSSSYSPIPGRLQLEELRVPGPRP